MSDAEILGQRLAETRESKELSLEDTKRATRIRVKYLMALEQGDYSDMTLVQAQGFLRNYARFLGLDYDLLLTELDMEKGRGRRRGIRGSRPDRHTESISSPHPTLSPTAQRPAVLRPRRGLGSTLLIVLIAGAIVIGLVFGVTWVFDTLADSDKQVETMLATMSVPPTENVGTADTVTTPDAATTPGPEPTYSPPPITGTGVIVMLEVLQKTWMQITVDGAVQYEGYPNPGEILNYVGAQSIHVRTNNAAGLELTVNNQAQGVLGERGQLFDQTFTLEGIAVPLDPVGEIPSGDTETSMLAAPTALTAAIVSTASPTEATLFFTPTDIPSLDPGNGNAQPELSPTSTATSTLPFTVTASETATVFNTGTFTPTPSITLTSTPLPTATPTLTRTPTLTSTPTNSLTPSATVTPSWTPSPQFSPTPSMTSTQTPFLPPRQTRTPSLVPK